MGNCIDRINKVNIFYDGSPYEGKIRIKYNIVNTVFRFEVIMNDFYGLSPEREQLVNSGKLME